MLTKLREIRRFRCIQIRVESLLSRGDSKAIANERLSDHKDDERF